MIGALHQSGGRPFPHGTEAQLIEIEGGNA